MLMFIMFNPLEWARVNLAGSLALARLPDMASTRSQG
jgi:hypothetical protein